MRAAFNSPLWPFVMATTSAGQEGIDFHRWCSAVIHWNTPSNPVDFEQREGRVHRFGGHAVRRNVAAAHSDDVLASSDTDPWLAAYEAALAAYGDLGDFSPNWVYPGAAKIERHLLPYPLSRDLTHYQQLKVDLATYRLTLRAAPARRHARAVEEARDDACRSATGPTSTARSRGAEKSVGGQREKDR